MSRLQCLLLLITLLVACSFAVPTDKKQRTMDKSLSDLEHEENGEHNADYDHDAFLGHEDKKTFDQLNPEESKDRLAIIVRKIDKDNDGLVSEDELQEWIQYVQKRYIINDTDRMWKDHHPDEDNTLPWKSYQKRTFGYEDDPNVKGSRTEAYADMINRDRRRWEKADKNRDDRLSKEEFMDFLHPEDAEHMRDIVVMETIEDIDKDKDGMIDLEEYIADIWGDDDDDDDEDDDDEDEHGEPDWVTSERDQFHQFRDKNSDGKLDTNEVREWIIPEDYDHSSAEAKHLIADSDVDKVCADMWPNRENAEDEPDWVKSERKQFETYRDENKDGKLDSAEVKHWILPDNFDHARAESKHLMYEADEDKDGKLSHQEILDKYDLFVGSQATDFGEALTRHEEF